MGGAVSAVTGVAVVLAVTHYLPKHTAGVFFALTSVFLIAETIARLGTGTGLVYAIARTRAMGTPERAGAFLAVALTPVVGLSLVLAAAMLIWAGPLAEVISGAHPAEAATAIRVLGLLLPLTTVSDTLVSATRGYGTIVPTVLLDRVGRPLLQFAAVFVAAVTGSVAVLSVGWAAPWVLCAAGAAIWLLRLQRPVRKLGTAEGPDGRTWREFWTFTGPRALTSVVQLALQRLDIVLIIVLIGPVQAALYTAATRFLVVGQFINQSLSTVVEPRLARLLSLGDRAASRTVYQAATGWLVLLCWPLYLLVATYATEVLRLFGHGYDAGTPVILVLAGAMLVATSVGMVDVVLIMGGRTSWNLVNAVLALAVMVGFDLTLIPHLGLLGAAAGWAAAILVNNLLPLVQVWRSLDLHPFGAGTGTAVALAVACFVLVPLGMRAAFGGGTLTVSTASAIGLAVYALGCWRWRGTLALDTLASLRRSQRGTTTAGSAATTALVEEGP
jgi:O-antigen/teichoic acid export membrane protein